MVFVNLMIYIPLWLLFVLVAAPTGFLLYRGRRRTPPGHCRKCHYNLTGNMSGICPECGTPARPESASADQRLPPA